MFFENDALAYTKPLLLRGRGFGGHSKTDGNRILKTTNKNKTSDPPKFYKMRAQLLPWGSKTGGETGGNNSLFRPFDGLGPPNGPYGDPWACYGQTFGHCW